ncbi:unnamed protein product [Effrenium voratum]|nr:unnamed protein product [Effrenium voratum]CAJ1420917.1 unnamed protein product [Effrenium voratum]
MRVQAWLLLFSPLSLAERVSDMLASGGVVDPDVDEPFPAYASSQNREQDLKRLSRMLKHHVESTGPLQQYQAKFLESDKEYKEAAEGLFASLNKFQDSVSEFRGKVADASSGKIVSIKERMAAKLPGVQGPHPVDEYSEADEDADDFPDSE